VFAEVVQGAGGEPAAVRDAWRRVLAAIESEGAGWLGATSGLATDGTFLAVLCSETEEMSRITMDRLAEASAWEQLAAAAGGLTFRECPHVRAFADVGDEQLAVVEVTQGIVNDIGRVSAVFRKTRGIGAGAGLLCWDDAGFACSILYRLGGQRTALAVRRDAESLFVDPQEHDLTRPWSVLGLSKASTDERPSGGEAEP